MKQISTGLCPVRIGGFGVETDVLPSDGARRRAALIAFVDRVLHARVARRTRIPARGARHGRLRRRVDQRIAAWTAIC
jgi:hypothetical protein